MTSARVRLQRSPQFWEPPIFIAWKRPTTITKQSPCRSRKHHRHTHAFGLFARRQRRLRAVLERIISRGDDMDVTAAAVVAVFQTYAKMNPAGQWVERSEHLKRNELFELMSQTEYRRDAELWRTSETLGAAAVVIPRIRSTDY